MPSRSTIIALLLFSLFGVSFADAQQIANEEETEIRKLMNERQQVLQQLVDAIRFQYREGETSLDAVIAAEQELLDAKLESAATPGERIAIREAQFKLAKQQEQHVARRVESAEISPKDLMTAKANRLTAHIRLLRERAAR